MMLRFNARRSRGGAVGNIITAILIIGLLALGGWLVLKNRSENDAGPGSSADSRPAAVAAQRRLSIPRTSES